MKGEVKVWFGGVPNWTSNWTCKWKWQLGSGVQGEVLGRVINLGVVSIEPIFKEISSRSECGRGEKGRGGRGE